MVRFAIGLALGLALGCRRDLDAAPSCGAVAAKFLLIAQNNLDASKADEATRRGVRAQLPAIRDSLATACSESTWSDSVRRCLHAANDHVGLETCQQQLTEVQRRALDRAARGETESR